MYNPKNPDQFSQADIPPVDAGAVVNNVPTESVSPISTFSQTELSVPEHTSKPSSEDYASTETYPVTEFHQTELAPVPDKGLNIVPAPTGSILHEGDFQSPNFRHSQTGWRIRSDGSAEFNSGVSVSQLDIPDQTSTNSFHVDSSGNAWWGASVAVGSAGASASVTKAGVATFQAGTIGGWSIGSTSLISGSGASTVGLSSSDTGDDDVRIYAGSSTPSSAPFRVLESGSVTMTNATVTGVLTASSGSSLFDYQTYTASGTWTKPTNASTNSMVMVQCWGGGGAGGGTVASTVNSGAGGGGGGYIRWEFRASDITATVAVTVATTAVGIAGDGPGGGTSSFGTYLTAYGGGGGGSANGGAVTAPGSGGGGGTVGAGGNGSSGGSNGTGGAPLGGAGGVSTAGDSTFGGGGGSLGHGGQAVYGGGGGGNTGADSTSCFSIYGGAGGQTATAGANIAGGTSVFGGAGGASGADDSAGVAGTAPGGGGGGAKRTSGSPSLSGGNGARGEVRVWTIY